MTAPEKIWIGCQVGKGLEIDCWSTTDQPDDGLEWQTIAEYTRTDSIPNPMQDPRVVALVEAAHEAKSILAFLEPHPMPILYKLMIVLSAITKEPPHER